MNMSETQLEDVKKKVQTVFVCLPKERFLGDPVERLARPLNLKGDLRGAKYL